MEFEKSNVSLVVSREQQVEILDKLKAENSWKNVFIQCSAFELFTAEAIDILREKIIEHYPNEDVYCLPQNRKIITSLIKDSLSDEFQYVLWQKTQKVKMDKTRQQLLRKAENKVTYVFNTMKKKLYGEKIEIGNFASNFSHFFQRY
jgi:hypothetical protein